MNMKKRLLLFFITFIIVASITTGVYAIYQSIYRKFPNTITTTNVSFLYNDKSYIDELETSNIKLTKGMPTEINMEVKTSGSSNIIVDYSIRFTVVEENDNILSNAISVYYYNGNSYEYIAKLAEFNDIDEENTPFKGKIISNNSRVIPIKLLYSEETNDEYDKKALAKNVIIKSYAKAEIISTNEYQFVSTKEEFKKALTSETNSQIFLLEDINLNETIKTSYKHGIDFNGYKLTLNGNNIEFDYSIESTSSFITNLYIGDKTGKGAIIATTGKIKIKGNDTFFVENNYLDNISYTLGDNPPNNLKEIINERMDLLASSKEYQTNDDFPLLDNLWGYTSYINFTNNDILNYDKETHNLSIKDTIAETGYYRYNVMGTYSNILIRGNSIEAIFEAIKAELKDLKVSSTINFKSYDKATKAHIEYIVDDGFDGKILNNNGIYQPNGLDYLESLEDYNVIRPRIYLMISKGNETMNLGLDDENTIKLYPLTTEQITDLVIDTNPTFFISFDTEKAYSDFLTTNKDKLSNIEITDITVDDTSVSDYLTNVENKIRFVNVPDNKIYETTLTVTVSYDILDETYTNNKTINITVLGKESYVTKYDISNRLNSKFNENDYTNGKSYTFTANGALSPSIGGKKHVIYVKYNIPDEYKKYVSIIYDYVIAKEIESQVSYFLKNTSSYTLIETDKRTIEKASLDESDAIFVELNEDDNYTGDKYNITNGKATLSDAGNYALLYSRSAIINILPKNVPKDEKTTVNITAELHERIDFSDAIYNNTTYNITFPVEGIINYGQDEGDIKNIQLYNALLECFDLNKDGIITYTESQSDITQVETNLEKNKNKYILKIEAKLDITEKSYFETTCLKFDGIKIDTIAGIENFSNINAYSFNNCNITDLSSLRTIHGLEYLSANNNNITNIEPLTLLDDLHYLDLSNNSISSIDSIAYLSKLQYINFDNNKLSDFNALKNMTTIRELSLNGMRLPNGNEFDKDSNIAYQLSLIMTNCQNDGKYAKINVGDNVFNLTENAQIAVTVLKQLEEINRVSKYLYLPAKYKEYDIKWTTNRTDLIEINDTVNNNGCYNYEIISPIVNTTISISAQVGSFAYQRTLNVTLVKFDNNSTYIKNDDSYLEMKEIIPDNNLIDAIFTTFNRVSDGTPIEITDSNGNKISTTERYVLSNKDFENGLITTNINWTNMGITSLKGIDYIFKNFSTKTSKLTLNLEGNPIEDLTDLELLNGVVESLTLSGQKYDFMKLVDTSDKSNIKVKLDLKKLDVSKCYSLDDEEVLKGLFWLYYYSTNSLEIYINSGKVWNPYEDLLNKKMSYLPMTLTFRKKGDYVDLFNTAGLYEIKTYSEYYSREGLLINFYDIPHLFTAQDIKIYSRLKEGSDFYSINNGRLTYDKMIACNETSYLVCNLNCTEKGFLSYNYVIQLNNEDQCQNIKVLNKNNQTVSDLFGSIELKEVLIDKFFTEISKKNKVNSKESVKKDTDYYYDEDAGVYYVNIEFFAKLPISSSLTLTGASSNTSLDPIYGLRYLPQITNLTVEKDFNAGDGADLVHLTVLKAAMSYVDFSQLKYELKLKSLHVLYFAGFVVNEDVGKYMKNLELLAINQSDHRSDKGFDYVYFDLHDLLYFNYKDTNNINTLFLNCVVVPKGAKDYRGLTNQEINEVIVPLRNAYLKNHTVEPKYYVGTIKTNKIDLTNNAKEDITSVITKFKEAYLVFDTNEDGSIKNVKTNNDSTSIWSPTGAPKENSKIDEFTNNDLNKYSELKCTDFGLKINGENWNTRDDKFHVTSGSTISLPTKSGLFLFGFTNDETNSVMKNNYPMTWYIWKKEANNTYTKTQLTGSDDYITYKCEKNEYILIVGVMNSDALFIYHFIVGTGDGIYNQINDDNLRLWAFINAECNNTNVLSLSSEFEINTNTKNSPIEILSYCKLLLTKHYEWKSTYSKKVTIASIDELSKAGVKDYLLNKFSSKTILNLNGVPYTDFSFFNQLVNIEILDISNSKFNNIDLSKFTKLTNLYIENMPNISPSIFDILSKTVNVLDVKGTKCDKNIDTFTKAQTWLENRELTLSINGQIQKIDSNKITVFFNDLNTIKNQNMDIFTTGHPLNALYSNGEMTGEGYSLKWPLAEQFRTGKIGENSYLPKTVSVSVYYTKTNTVFSDIPVTFNFNSSSTSPAPFETSNGKVDLSELNFEIIATCIQKEAFTYDKQANAFVLTKDVEITDNNIKACILNNFANFTKIYEGGYLKLKLSNNYVIKLKLDDSYNNLYTDSNFTKVNTEGSITGSSFDKKKTIDLGNYFQLSFGENSFLFYDVNVGDNSVIREIHFMKYVFIDGVRYEIKLKANDNSLESIVINNEYIRLDSEKLLKLNVTEKTVGFKLYVLDNNNEKYIGNKDSKSNVLSVKITKKEMKNYALNSYTLYVEVLRDNNGKYYIPTGTNGVGRMEFDDETVNNNLIVTSKEVKNISGKFQDNDITKSEKFTLNESGSCYLIKGSAVFASGRFQYRLLEDCYNYFTLHDSNNKIIGTVISQYLISVTTKLKCGGNSGNARAITSIEGIQIFTKLKEFNFEGGNFHSIEGLRTLQLTSFRYATSDINAYTIVEDFSPLIEGSRKTLQTFEYANRSNSYINDLSFLLQFEALKTVKILAISNIVSVSQAIKYAQLPNFFYLVNELNNKNVNIQINKSEFDKKCASVKYLYDLTPSGNNYSIKVKSQYKEMVRLLNLYTISSYYEDSPILTNNYLLRLNLNEVKNDYVYLPATIDDKGKLTLVEYEKASSGFVNFEYYLKTPNGDKVLTKEEALAKIEEIDFYSNQLAKNEVLYVRAKVAKNNIQAERFNECGYLKLNMRILVSLGEMSYYAVRTLTLQFEE